MIISRTPMRVSFAGGGSDLASYYTMNRIGMVVSTAIDKYIYITVNKKFDNLIRVSYSKTEMVEHVDQVEHNIIREAMKIVGIDRGVEIVYMGDIPLGSAGIGLGSSSSLAVGVLNALYAFKGQHVSAEKLAMEACKIEIDILENPIGKQDQYIAAYGGFQQIQFLEDEKVYVDPVIFNSMIKDSFKNKLMLFYTGITRVSSNILEEQNKNTKDKVDYLDSIVDLAKDFKTSLVQNEYEKCGEMLAKGWELKKELASGISNDKINHYYESAIKAGAVGGKVLGAGGGGFLLFYCDEIHQAKVRIALKDLNESTFKFEPQGSKIIYVQD
jgi:D-glycero-alpha-D-manno-heptose-7-phosphate kinase